MKRFIPWLSVLVLLGVVTWGAIRHFGKDGNTLEEVVSAPPATIPTAPDPQYILPIESEEAAVAAAPEEIHEPTAADKYEEAVAADEAGNTAGAIDLYKAVMQMEPASDAAARSALRLVAIHLAQNKKTVARDYYNVALQGTWTATQRETIVAQLQKLNEEILLGPGQNADTKTYIVKKGDSLSKISRQYKITVGYLKKINNLTSDLIRIDDELKVVEGPFDACVDKSDLTLTIKHKGKFVKQYKVGLGKDNSTPVGTWAVQTKLIEPDWNTPEGVIPYGDPDNVLGTRWVGFHRGYGIHGTSEPESIGLYSSKGCVRMLNKEVEELYDLLTRRHSKVTIQE